MDATTKLKDLLRDLKRGALLVPQAPGALESVGEVLKSAGKGKPMPKNLPAMDPAWTPSLYDVESWLNGAIDKGVGYWRGYVKPRLRDLVK